MRAALRLVAGHDVAVGIIDGPYTQVGTNEIRNILGNGKAFSFPKPTGLIEQLLAYVLEDKEALILDFFAGSGTTGHVVHKLSAADGGRRRCILVSSTEAIDEQLDKTSAVMCARLG